jgi:hypothetical protein
MVDGHGNVLEHEGYRHPPHPKAIRVDGVLYRTVERQEQAPQPRRRRRRMATRKPPDARPD